MDTDTAIAGIRSALEAQPDNETLRLHLVDLLRGGGRFAEALAEVQVLLADHPDSAEYQLAAAQCAQDGGNAELAARYRTVCEALRSLKGQRLVEGPSAVEDEEEYDRDELPERIAVGGPVDEHDTWETDRPTIRLQDVAGMAEVKRRLELAFLGPMRNPELRRMYGKTLRGGLLLYGPPGCGKTYIARAVAGELGAAFISVGLSDVLDMWLGQSERNLHALFEEARRQRPCVLFLDEIDALGRKRSLMRESAGRDVVNQLLTELDGVSGNNEDLFVLAASNHPWDVDVALRRPGRLDRTLLVLPPDAPAREAILANSLAARPTERLDVRGLAKRLEGYSGADVVHLCDSAAELAMEDCIRTGRPRPIRQDDLLLALKDVHPSTNGWLEIARNYAQFANEGGAYDDLLKYLRSRGMA